MLKKITALVAKVNSSVFIHELIFFRVLHSFLPNAESVGLRQGLLILAQPEFVP